MISYLKSILLRIKNVFTGKDYPPGICIHSWEKWGEYGYQYQRRKCRICGLLQEIKKENNYTPKNILWSDQDDS